MPAELALSMPVTPPIITSGYSLARPNPLGPGVMAHQAIDFRAALGQEVYAVTGGVVAKSYVSTGDGYPRGHPLKRVYSYGERLVIDHEGGYSTSYCHLSRRLVRVGDCVRAGQVIGYAGSTGDSTGPHLHFELMRSGRFIDPTPFLFPVAPKE
jgi:murein DD-endopeptidase MepM/ murein hydrolase activator NlpD